MIYKCPPPILPNQIHVLKQTTHSCIKLVANLALLIISNKTHLFNDKLLYLGVQKWTFLIKNRKNIIVLDVFELFFNKIVRFNLIYGLCLTNRIESYYVIIINITYPISNAKSKPIMY